MTRPDAFYPHEVKAVLATLDVLDKGEGEQTGCYFDGGEVFLALDGERFARLWYDSDGLCWRAEAQHPPATS